MLQKYGRALIIFIPSKSGYSAGDISLNVNGSVNSDPLTVANTFNEFLTSIAGKIKNQIRKL